MKLPKGSTRISSGGSIAGVFGGVRIPGSLTHRAEFEIMSSVLDKRAQETAKAFRLESLSLYDQVQSNNQKAASNSEVLTILDGFQLILSENIQQPEYHSYLFSDFLEAAC